MGRRDLYRNKLHNVEGLGGERLLTMYDELSERNMFKASLWEDRPVVVTGLWDTFPPELDDEDRATVRRMMGVEE